MSEESGHDPELFAELMRAERAATPISGKAIAALVFGLLGGLLALVYGAIAIVEIRKGHRRGLPLVIGGLVAFAVWAVFGGLWLTGTFSGKNAHTGLAAHDCFSTSQGTTVSCTEPHDREVISVADQYAPERCPAQARTYLDPALNYPDLLLEHATAENRSVCVFTARGTVSKPARELGVPFTAEQQRYLTAVSAYGKQFALSAARSAPREEVAKMVPLIEAELAALRAPWSPVAQPSIDRLAAELKYQLTEWQAAGSTKTETELTEVVSRMRNLNERQQDVRQNLGLSRDF